MELPFILSVYHFWKGFRQFLNLILFRPFLHCKIAIFKQIYHQWKELSYRENKMYSEVLPVQLPLQDGQQLQIFSESVLLGAAAPTPSSPSRQASLARSSSSSTPRDGISSLTDIPTPAVHTGLPWINSLKPNSQEVFSRSLQNTFISMESA